MLWLSFKHYDESAHLSKHIKYTCINNTHTHTQTLNAGNKQPTAQTEWNKRKNRIKTKTFKIELRKSIYANSFSFLNPWRKCCCVKRFVTLLTSFTYLQYFMCSVFRPQNPIQFDLVHGLFQELLSNYCNVVHGNNFE